MKARHHSKETRDRMSAKGKAAWARLSPEKRESRAGKLAELRRIKMGRLLPISLGSSTIDEDFDEGLS